MGRRLRAWLKVLAVAVVGLGALSGTSGTASASAWTPSGDGPLPLYWALSGPVNVHKPAQVGERDFAGHALPSPAVLDIDGQMNTAQTVAALHDRGQRVICYFDAGVYENYRPDASLFPPEVIGKADGNWAGSRWLDIRNIDVLAPIMQARIDDCVAKGFDMVEPDEIDGWENDTGFPLTYQDQVNYNRMLAQWAHDRGIAILQKGDIIQTQDLVDHFDATLNEECVRYRECTNPWNPATGETEPGLQLYSQQHKPVWIAEYRPWLQTRLCRTVSQHGWNGAIYRLGLPINAGRKPC